MPSPQAYRWKIAKGNNIIEIQKLNNRGQHSLALLVEKKPWKTKHIHFEIASGPISYGACVMSTRDCRWCQRKTFKLTANVT
ncbi:hypothetical protein TNCV_1672581 [Trichonephila clavipes]|nr:hypothetical protein TNCV_1672581 [Trichonephila clavipes]